MDQTTIMRRSSQGVRQRARKHSDAQHTVQSELQRDEPQRDNLHEDEAQGEEPKSQTRGGRKLRRGRRRKANVLAQSVHVPYTSLEESVQGAYTSKFNEVFDDSEASSHDEGPALSKNSSPTKAPRTLRALPNISKPRAKAALPENQAPSPQRAPPTDPSSTYARIVRVGNGEDERIDTADRLNRFAGPAPPPLRGFPNFPQSNPSRANLPLGSGRLQNTNKLGARRFGISECCLRYVLICAVVLYQATAQHGA